jgi:DNA repair protein RadC
MNTELTDEELMNFFLTSEFEDIFTAEEYKYLLHKFRFFYRLLNAKQQSLKHDSDTVKDELKNLKEYIDRILTEKNTEIEDLKKENNEVVSRKLTFRERLMGKLIIPKKKDK